ncbi:MAG TPA: ester cyclase, partial [Puia sp.]|nr:ester cyclase [Puia sp.]
MKKFLVFISAFAFVMGCNNKSETGSMPSGADSALAALHAKDSMVARNKATAMASEMAFNGGKVDEIFKDAVPDAVDYGDGSMKPIKGLDSIKAGIKDFLAAFPDFKGENLMALGEGNMVAVFGEWSGTFKNPLGKMKPTGKSFKAKDCDLFTFNDAGKITEHRAIQSGGYIMEQL